MLQFYQEQVKFDKTIVSALYYTNTLSWIQLTETSVYFTPTYYPASDPSSLLSLNTTNTAHTNFTVFHLIRHGLESTTYHIQGEHASHYTNGADSGSHKNTEKLLNK